MRMHTEIHETTEKVLQRGVEKKREKICAKDNIQPVSSDEEIKTAPEGSKIIIAETTD